MRREDARRKNEQGCLDTTDEEDGQQDGGRANLATEYRRDWGAREGRAAPLLRPITYSESGPATRASVCGVVPSYRRVAFSQADCGCGTG